MKSSAELLSLQDMVEPATPDSSMMPDAPAAGIAQCTGG